jgi:co-chaperonin GroES (HSP10)
MIKRGIKNCVLVELEKLSDNEYSFASGAKILIDTTYKPEHHQRIYGKCVAVPEILTKGDLIKYDEGDYRYIDSIVPEVQVDDIVYFSYVAVSKTSIIEHEGKSYCNINYSSILCVIRNGEIIPIGGNILCEEYFGPTAKPMEIDGKTVYAETSRSGLVTGIAKASNNHAVVKIVGKPLKEDDQELEPGDVVMFPTKFGFKNNIEGIDYVFLKYWDLHAIVGKSSEVLV